MSLDRQSSEREAQCGVRRRFLHVDHATCVLAVSPQTPNNPPQGQRQRLGVTETTNSVADWPEHRDRERKTQREKPRRTHGRRPQTGLLVDWLPTDISTNSGWTPAAGVCPTANASSAATKKRRGTINETYVDVTRRMSSRHASSVLWRVATAPAKRRIERIELTNQNHRQ